AVGGEGQGGYWPCVAGQAETLLPSSKIGQADGGLAVPRLALGPGQQATVGGKRRRVRRAARQPPEALAGDHLPQLAAVVPERREDTPVRGEGDLPREIGGGGDGAEVDGAELPAAGAVPQVARAGRPLYLLAGGRALAPGSLPEAGDQPGVGGEDDPTDIPRAGAKTDWPLLRPGRDIPEPDARVALRHLARGGSTEGRHRTTVGSEYQG